MPGTDLTLEACRPLRGARRNAACTSLDDGRVLVAGGASGAGAGAAMVASCEIFDAELGIWRVAAPLSLPRQDLAMLRLADGRVLTAGGRLDDRTPLDTVEIFDPERDCWSRHAPLPTPVWGARIVTLAPARALLVGGFDPSGPSTATWWIDGDGSLSPGPPCNHGHAYHAAVRLTSGAVLVSDLASEILAGDRWQHAAVRNRDGADAAAAIALDDDQALITGGRDARDEHARDDGVLWTVGGRAQPSSLASGGRWGHTLLRLEETVVSVGGVYGEPARFVSSWESWTAASG